MYDIFLIAYVGIMKGFNLRKIKVSMAKSQNMSLRLVLTDLVKPKKRKRVAKEIDQFGDKTDQPQSKTMKVVVNEHISPKKEKEVYKKENLGTIDEEKPTTENKDHQYFLSSVKIKTKNDQIKHPLNFSLYTNLLTFSFSFLLQLHPLSLKRC